MWVEDGSEASVGVVKLSSKTGMENGIKAVSIYVQSYWDMCMSAGMMQLEGFLFISYLNLVIYVHIYLIKYMLLHQSAAHKAIAIITA